MRDSLIIVSGGMDSVSMLHEYRDKIALALTFDYGSNHASREIPLASLNCSRLGIEHKIIRLPFFKDNFISSLLSGGDNIPVGEYNEENMASTVVPFRNGIMLSIAAGIADSHNLSYIMIANHSGDHFLYPDCRPEFIEALGEAIEKGTDGRVKLIAPYTELSKADIVRRGYENGVDFSLTYSCYKGGEKHCGICGTCKERKQAFFDAGITDPTQYEE